MFYCLISLNSPKKQYLNARLFHTSQLPSSSCARAILAQVQVSGWSRCSRWPTRLGERLLAWAGSSALLQCRVVAGRGPTPVSSFPSFAAADEGVEPSEGRGKTRPHDRQVEEKDWKSEQSQDHCCYFANWWVWSATVVPWNKRKWRWNYQALRVSKQAAG